MSILTITEPAVKTKPAPAEAVPAAGSWGLGDGLVLRFATAADGEALAEFNGHVFGPKEFNRVVAAYTRDLVSPDHPTCGPEHTTLVEDTRRGAIVSTMCLIPQVWTYAGVPFGVGRPEAVATDPAYRRCGLVRRQFDLLHARSTAQGHLMQAITGIPWYYRQFGYEYGFDLSGGRMTPLSDVPALKAGESEAFRLRPLTMDDVPFVAPLYKRDCARSLLACPRPAWMWRTLITWYRPESEERRPFHVIETVDGTPIGYVSPSRDLWGDNLPVTELAVVEGQSLRAAMPALLRWLKEFASAEAAAQERQVTNLFFAFGRTAHPVYDAIPEYLPRPRLSYAWYVRIPDVPAFLRRIAPALAARLRNSALAGYTGEIKINEYRGGLRLVFKAGELVIAEPWLLANNDDAAAAFPPLVFLQLLCGRAALPELRRIFPDCWANEEAAALLAVLFPQQASCLIPLG